MPLTNAEKQAAHRKRQAQRMADLQEQVRQWTAYAEQLEDQLATATGKPIAARPPGLRVD